MSRLLRDIRSFNEIAPDDVLTVGGKGLSLGLLAGAGLPVPPGFCVTSDAQRRLRGGSPQDDPTLGGQITEAYHLLGGGPVAVRSSATAEDGSLTSFAGQQETFLGVTGAAAVLDAIARCWASLDSARAVAYRRHQGVADEGLAMAVVVQRLVPAEVSGVLFTRDPLDPTGRRMVVEAAWGLGESVVSGRVMPDRYHLDRETGAMLDRHVSTKPTQLTAAGPQPVPAERQNEPCLDDAQLAELAELGRRVEAFYGDARDVEWARADGRFWLLQARPITTGGAAEREQVRREEMAALAAKAEPGGTVWARYNLAEVLPEPTPMTWAIVRRFLSGRGGFGQMYRDLGFEPDPVLDEEGIYDLICGRPYCNLSREPRMQFRWLPFEHAFAALKAEPSRAFYPQPVLNPARAGWRFWLLLPWLLVKLTRASGRLRRESATFARRFREEALPTFLAATAREPVHDHSDLDSRTLLDLLEQGICGTLYDFARESLKPTVLAAVALGNLERALLGALGAEKARAALGELTLGVRPDPEADLPAALQALAAGRMERQTFLQHFGHRGNHEMELAQPRWDEDPEALDRLIAQQGGTQVPSPPPSEGSAAAWQRLAAEAKWTPSQEAALRTELDRLHTYLGLRETAKHYLMKGYAGLRKILVELDRRYGLAGGVFYLTPEELPRLLGGEDLSALVAGRRRRRALALSLEVPPVLFSDDLEAIGRPIPVAGADRLQGVPLSAGVAEGPALVLEEPTAAAGTAESYILVCPSTDPAWVPLFVRARGLVMETGGVLSHGAIVAREFGLPAVAGLPGVVRRLRSGQRLRVEGGSGVVWILSED
jgi:pyruvate,water dikinase